MVGLFHRERTGDGQRIDVSLFNTAVALQCQEITAFLNMERRFERSDAGIGGAWLSAPFGIYRTADRPIAIAMASLSVVGELIGAPELAAFDDDRHAFDDRDEAYRIVQDRLLERPAAEWLEVLATKDVWAAPVNAFDDLVDDPHVAHNDLIRTVQHPAGGQIRVVGVPMRFSETPGEIRSGPPRVGEHTDDVLEEAGFSPQEIASLRDDGAMGP
jgi:crotonobetainyl-CoA:carnitine CoA-transferase CaiB-like acyl-CoA transferase